MRKPTLKSLKLRCDKIFSEVIKRRSEKSVYAGYCPTCCFRPKANGTNAGTEACHIFSRAHLATRWDLRNAYWGCFACNICYEHDAGFQEKVHQWWKKDQGQETWDGLNAMWHTPTKLNKADLKDLFESLTHAL